MKKLFTTLALSGIALAASAQTTPGVAVTEQPEGFPMEYELTYSGYYVSMDLEYVTDQKLATELVMDTEGGLWFKDMCPFFPMGTYVRGQMTFDNTVEVQLPQTYIVDQGDDDEEIVFDLQVFKMNDEGMPEPVEDLDKNLLIFDYQDDGSLKLRDLEDGYSIGLNRTDMGMWMGFSVTAMTYAEGAGTQLVTPPDGVSGKEYSYITWGIGNTPEDPKDYGYRVEVAFDGDDVYFRGLSLDLPKIWVQGKRDGNRIIMPNNQPMGNVSVLTVTLQYCKEDSEALGGYSLLPEDTEFVWIYDEEKGEFTTEDPSVIIIFNTMQNGDIKFLQMMESPVLTYQPDMSGAPMAPWGMKFFARNATSNFDLLDFNLPQITDEGVLLPRENLYYRLYIDGEQMEILDEDFQCGEDMWDIPYSFDRNLIVCNVMNTAHEMGIRIDGYDSVGIQSVNKYEGKEYASEVVTYTLNSGVNLTEASEVESEQLYDLNGLKADGRQGGIYVKRTQFTDGTVTYTKVATQRR